MHTHAQQCCSSRVYSRVITVSNFSSAPEKIHFALNLGTSLFPVKDDFKKKNYVINLS